MQKKIAQGGGAGGRARRQARHLNPPLNSTPTQYLGGSEDPDSVSIYFTTEDLGSSEKEGPFNQCCGSRQFCTGFGSATLILVKDF